MRGNNAEALLNHEIMRDSQRYIEEEHLEGDDRRQVERIAEIAENISPEKRSLGIIQFKMNQKLRREPWKYSRKILQIPETFCLIEKTEIFQNGFNIFTNRFGSQLFDHELEDSIFGVRHPECSVVKKLEEAESIRLYRFIRENHNQKISNHLNKKQFQMEQVDIDRFHLGTPLTCRLTTLSELESLQCDSIKLRIEKRLFTLFYPNINRLKLDNHFSQRITALPIRYGEDFKRIYTEFFDEFGTCFVSHVFCGGEMEERVTLTEDDESFEEEVRQILSRIDVTELMMKPSYLGEEFHVRPIDEAVKIQDQRKGEEVRKALRDYIATEFTT